jgi:hypothetical protein
MDSSSVMSTIKSLEIRSSSRVSAAASKLASAVSSATAWNSPQTVGISLHVITVKPDFDADGDVDLSDFGHLQACLSGAGVPQNNATCQDAKLDPDSDVDSSDVAIFRRCLSGPDIPTNPNCAN